MGRYRPQLATLVKTPPEGDEWLHEIKYDGYRIGRLVEGSSVRLISRNGRDWTEPFPAIVERARSLPVRRVILDGEMAVLLPDGRTSFQALQSSMRGSAGTYVVHFAFDLLHRDAEDLSRLPLEDRKAALAELLGRRLLHPGEAERARLDARRVERAHASSEAGRVRREERRSAVGRTLGSSLGGLLDQPPAHHARDVEGSRMPLTVSPQDTGP